MNNQNEEIKNCCIPDMEDIRCNGVTIYGCANPEYRLYNWDPFHPSAHKHCTVPLNEMQRILNAEIVRAKQAETEIKESLDSKIDETNHALSEKIDDRIGEEVSVIRKAISMLSPNQQDALSVAEAVIAIQSQLNGYSLRSVTELEYEQLVSTGQIDENTLYFVEEPEDTETE